MRPFSLVLASGLVVAGGQNRPQPDRTNAVHAQMNNVKYHFTDKIFVQINRLTGNFVPQGKNEFPVFDDKESFKITIDSAEIAISADDLANLLNSYVFARKEAPLSAISIASMPNGSLKVKGRLRDKRNIPFETVSKLSPTSDGKLRLHSDKVSALHVPVKGLMEAFGIEVGGLIKSGKVPGVTAEGNDLILDLGQILPPPHIDGKVTAVRVEANSIIQTFGPALKLDKKISGNYMWFQKNRLRFGRLTMDDTNLILLDLNPSDPLDFFLDHYKDQLAAGYTKISPDFQLRVFVKDYDKLNLAKSPPSKTN